MRNALFILLLSCCQIGTCCSCGHHPSVDVDIVKKAEHIFVFRLLSAEVEAPHANEVASDATGRIEYVESLRGSGKQFSRISFSTLSLCCGARLDVGQFYIGFASGAGPMFEANTGNVLNSGSAGYERLKESLIRVISGKAKFEDAISEYDLYRTQQIPRPPQPCPQNGP